MGAEASEPAEVLQTEFAASRKVARYRPFQRIGLRPMPPGGGSRMRPNRVLRAWREAQAAGSQLAEARSTTGVANVHEA